jgi:2,3-bisphosphoglycerate-independent phosphoglycerate mutase
MSGWQIGMYNSLGLKIARGDVNRRVQEGTSDDSVCTTVLPLPDQYSKGLARQLMKQLRESWRNGDINMQVAEATTIRVPLLKLVDFQKSEAVQALKPQENDAKQKEKMRRKLQHGRNRN